MPEIKYEYQLSQQNLFTLNKAQLLLKQALDLVKSVESTKTPNPDINSTGTLVSHDPVILLQGSKGLIMAANNQIDNAINENKKIYSIVFRVHYLQEPKQIDTAE